MVVRKVVALNVVSKYELHALLCEVTSIMCITYLLSSIFLTYFYKYVKWGQGESGWLDYQSRNSQGILIHVLGMNPVYNNIESTKYLQ